MPEQESLFAPAPDQGADLALPDPAAEGAPPAADAPLAERLRPRTLDEVVGQSKLLAAGQPLERQPALPLLRAAAVD